MQKGRPGGPPGRLQLFPPGTFSCSLGALGAVSKPRASEGPNFGFFSCAAAPKNDAIWASQTIRASEFLAFVWCCRYDWTPFFLVQWVHTPPKTYPNSFKIPLFFRPRSQTAFCNTFCFCSLIFWKNIAGDSHTLATLVLAEEGRGVPWGACTC